jgi:selenocysteine lyase/cysteine desulfurase
VTPRRPAGAFDAAALRARFPALSARRDKRLVYLDNACTVLKSREVLAATTAFYETLGACGGKRSTHLLAQEVEAAALEARRAAAGFLGAESPNEIVFTSGTTEAANLVARAFPYDETRREVVITDLEHNAVFLPFFEAAQRNEIELKICRSRNGRIVPADLDAMVSEKTALVCVTHASNVTGGVQPVAEIVRLARAKGARVFVDDAQFVSSHRENVQALQADFVAFSAHKIGGPFGMGVLFGKEQELNRLRHFKVGGGTVKSVRWDGTGLPEVRYLDAPERFEAGVANFGAMGGLTAAIRLLEGLDPAAVRSHAASLVRRTVDGLLKIPHLRIVGDAGDLETGSLVSFHSTSEDFGLEDLNLYLNHELRGDFVALRRGEHCAHLLHQSLGLPGTMRVSFFAYNTEEDVDAFLAGLESYSREALA